jgi:hypothetical protein
MISNTVCIYSNYRAGIIVNAAVNQIPIIGYIIRS